MNYTLESFNNYLNDRNTIRVFINNCIFYIKTGQYENIYNKEIIEPENTNCLRFSYCNQSFQYNCLLKPSNSNFTLKIITEYNKEYNYDIEPTYIKREFKNIKNIDDLFEVIVHKVYHLICDYDNDGEYMYWFKADYIEELIEELDNELKKIEDELKYDEVVVVPVINMLLLGDYEWKLPSDVINIIVKNI